MRKTTALLFPLCCVFVFGGLPQPGLAFDGFATTGEAVGPDDIAQQDDDVPDYGDIMDDVDAVIGAMDEAMGSPAPAGETRKTQGFVASRSQPNQARPHPAHPKTAQPRIAQGPRTPSPIVIELFTAQGCAACPPAEEMLGSLQGRTDVLALSWHVDYWDYLGWADSFAQPAFSDRQKGYNRSRGARSLFTPQMIVAGETALDDPNPAALMAAVKYEQAEGDHVAITRRIDGGRTEIELSPLINLPDDIAVQLIRYVPDRTVEVAGGENMGRRLSMYNVVVDNEVLAMWDGKAPLRMTVRLGAGRATSLPPDTRHALIVQRMHKHSPGEIFATVLLD